MLVDKNLGISEELILDSVCIKQLVDWRIMLSNKMTEILVKNNAETFHELPAKARNAYMRSNSLYKSVRMRIGYLHKKDTERPDYVSPKQIRDNRIICNRFMAVAKRELSKKSIIDC